MPHGARWRQTFGLGFNKMHILTDRLFTLFCAGLAIAGFAVVIYWPLDALGILDLINVESHR